MLDEKLREHRFSVVGELNRVSTGMLRVEPEITAALLDEPLCHLINEKSISQLQVKVEPVVAVAVPPAKKSSTTVTKTIKPKPQAVNPLKQIRRITRPVSSQ